MRFGCESPVAITGRVRTAGNWDMYYITKAIILELYFQKPVDALFYQLLLFKCTLQT